MIVYLDASALVKQYVAESGSAEVNALIARAEADWSMTTLLHPVPEAFYAAYQEVYPLQAGWRAPGHLFDQRVPGHHGPLWQPLPIAGQPAHTAGSIRVG